MGRARFSHHGYRRRAAPRRSDTPFAALVGLGGFAAALLVMQQTDGPVRQDAALAPAEKLVLDPWVTAQNDAAAQAIEAESRRAAATVSRGSGAADALGARFTLCHSGGGQTCVVDGDTIWFEGVKIRLTGFDTPETHPPRCAAEARAGDAATRRMLGLLNAGAFSLERGGDRDTDRYGRKLRRATRDGANLGDVLIAEGLARPYGGGYRAGWC